MSWGKGIIQGKAKPCHFDQCFIGFECKINLSKTGQYPDILTSLDSLVVLKHLISETNV